MKKLLIILTAGTFFLQANAQIKTTVRNQKRNDRESQLTTRTFTVGEAEFDMKTLFWKDKNEVVNSIGCKFGNHPRNGGWDRWNFLRLHYKEKNKTVNILQECESVGVAVFSADGTPAADLSFPVTPEAQAQIRIMAFQSHPNWLFLRIRCPQVPGLTPTFLQLTAYPGGAAALKERERSVATRENVYDLTGQSASFTPQSGAFALFNRFASQEYGNLAVFNPEDFPRIEIFTAAAQVLIRFYLKENVREICLAIGSFSKVSADDFLPRFLNEESGSVLEFLKNVKWDTPVDAAGIKEKINFIRHEMKKQNADYPQFGKLEQQAEKAIAESDLVLFSQTEAELDTIRKELVRKGLEAFK